jgi:hypothetical protein
VGGFGICEEIKLGGGAGVGALAGVEVVGAAAKVQASGCEGRENGDRSGYGARAGKTVQYRIVSTEATQRIPYGNCCGISETKLLKNVKTEL